MAYRRYSPACCAKNAMTNWTNATTEALTEAHQPRSEKRYFFAPESNGQPFYDMDARWLSWARVSADQNWLRARPPLHSRTACRGAILNHRAWLYRSYGWARRNHRKRVDLRLAPATNGWSSPRSMLSTVNRASGWRRPDQHQLEVFGQPDWLVEFACGRRMLPGGR